MMDLVERLRLAAKASAFFSTILPQSNSNAMAGLLNEAADTIERLNKELMDLKMLTCCCIEPEEDKSNG